MPDDAEPHVEARSGPDGPGDQPAIDYDWLGFSRNVKGLCQLLTEVETPFVLGIYGDWGTGKTSLMRHLQKALRDAGHLTVWFNPWKYDNREEVWKAFVRAVYTDVRHQQTFLKFGLQHVKDTIEDGARQIANMVGRMAGVGDTGNEVHDLLNLDKQFLNAFEDEFERLLREALCLASQHNKDHGKEAVAPRLTVFVDDLDRCSPEAVLEVIEALKLYLEVPNCLFVLGINQEVVSQAVHQKYGLPTMRGADGDAETAEAVAYPLGLRYLEKIVQLPFHLPPTDDADLKTFLSEVNRLTPPPEGVREAQWVEYLTLVANATNRNPRQIKRFALTLRLLSGIAPSTIRVTGSALETPFDRLKLAKIVLVQFVDYQLYKLIRNVPEALLDRQTRAQERLGATAAESPTAPRETRHVSPKLDEILSRRPLFSNAEEVSCYVRHSAGSPSERGSHEAQPELELALERYYKVDSVPSDYLLNLLADLDTNALSEHVEALARTMNEPDDPRNFKVALLLGCIGRRAKAGVPSLERAAAMPSSLTTTAAQVALTLLTDNDTAVRDSIANWAVHDHPAIRWMSMYALARTPALRQLAVPLAANALEDSDDIVRYQAVDTLRMIGTKEAGVVPALVRAVDVPSTSASYWAQLDLDYTHRVLKDDVPELAALLSHESALVVEYAAKALGRVGRGAASASPGLKAVALTNERPKTRTAAVRAMGLIAEPVPENVEALLQAAHDRSVSVQAAVAVALGRIGAKSGAVTDALRHLAAATHAPLVSRSAQKALDRLTQL
ncbi:MAG: P-loop NTPase fold protein [Armatimonadia bacterium]